MGTRATLVLTALLVVGGGGKKDRGPTPIVMWHGMGDSCCFSFSMGAIMNIIQQEIPGVYIHSVRIGKNVIEDVENGFMGNMNEHVEEACKAIANDERLKDGYYGLGFSQGAQFLRGVGERCSNPPMKKYISLGGQQQGVYGAPNCETVDHNFCDYVRRILNYAAYVRYVQEKFVQASYWHNPLQEEEYSTHNLFLADINNAHTINQTYKDNIRRLSEMVLVLFTNDTKVRPVISQWFGFYKPGQSFEIEHLEETRLYKEDRLGLKELSEAGKIHYLSVPADHLGFTTTWFIKNIVRKHLV